jgi:hypothetical protein
MTSELRSTREPCLTCGDETASGSPLYSDRRVIPDSGFLCAECARRAAAPPKGASKDGTDSPASHLSAADEATGWYKVTRGDRRR